MVEDKDKPWCPGRESCISCASLYTAKLKSPAMEEELMATHFPGALSPGIYCKMLLHFRILCLELPRVEGSTSPTDPVHLVVGRKFAWR